MSERKEKIRQFLGRFFRHREIGDDDDVFALGFVNSMLAMQLVSFLEKDFGIRLEDEDLELSNFRTISNMDALVGRKLATADLAKA